MHRYGQKADGMILQREDNKYILVIPKIHLVRHFSRVDRGNPEFGDYYNSSWPYQEWEGKILFVFQNNNWDYSKKYKNYLSANQPKQSKQ
jgi:hypothetical protein